MQQFALFVTKSSYDSRNAESAFAFCEAAIALGHKIEHVFFYQAGVHNASALIEVNADEVNMKERWELLHAKHGVPLYVCETAATRRGVICSRHRVDSDIQNMNPSFQSVGMSAYFAALHNEAIKSIQF
ncbi:sulfurtransferase complex subunit TusD [Glaciecola sp. SC05]|uniref:sulfurtransferase complex subunit TusD n=1 Tax=Glaciecola sp. SC05 TaxID=1987355 RepID=UPI0035285F1F